MILLGAKAPIVEGAMLSSVLVPFIKLEPPYDELKQLITRITSYNVCYTKLLRVPCEAGS